MYIKNSLISSEIQEVFTVRPQQLDYLFSQIRCCKVRVRSKQKQENGIYRSFRQITNKQVITKTGSLQGIK